MCICVIAIWIFIHFGILHFNLKLNWTQLLITLGLWLTLALWLAQTLYFHIILMFALCCIKCLVPKCNNCVAFMERKGSQLQCIDYKQHWHNLLIIKLLLVIVIILFVYSVLIDVIHSEYYAHGNVMHIGFQFCRKMKATEWYTRMRYGFSEDDIADHSMHLYIKNWKQFVDDQRCQSEQNWDESSTHTLSVRALFPFAILCVIMYSFWKISIKKIE